MSGDIFDKASKGGVRVPRDVMEELMEGRTAVMAERVAVVSSVDRLAASVVAEVMSSLKTVHDAYNSADWKADWRVEEVDQFGRVSKAKLVSAEGGNGERDGRDEYTQAIGFGKTRIPEALLDRVGVAAAAMLRGKKAVDKAVFGWQADSFEFWNAKGVVPSVGAMFSSTSDSFYRSMEGADGTEEAQVEVRFLRARYKDGELHIKAVFKTR